MRRSVLSVCERILIHLGLDRAALQARAREFWRNGEPEVRLLPLLVDPNRTAVDVGAANGVYSWHLMRLASKVVGFEPNPQSFEALRKAAPNLELHQIALSDKEGTATLRIPISRNVAATGWGTIHPGNDFREIWPDDVLVFEVKTARLDEVGLKNIGFIKIDVEGHELEVLKGAINLIENQRPKLLIETGGETRGNDRSAVFAALRDLGYICLHLRNGVSIECISPLACDQAPANMVAIPNKTRV
jgi:FkbM family methyltransferase